MLVVNLDPFPTLTTNNLLLRKIEPEDAEEILFLRSDESVMQFIDRPRPKSLENAIS